MSKNQGVFYDRPHQNKPQINLARSTTERIYLINICAFLAILQSSLGDSFSSFFVALGAILGAILTELLISYKKGNWKTILDGSALTTALVLSLLLPNNISPVYAAAGAVFAIAIIKHSFGGLGSNWLNPAAGGWFLIRFSWPGAFASALEGSSLYEIDAFLISPYSESLFAESIRNLLNRTVFSITGAQIPVGYMDLFISPYPGIIADRSILILLIGSIIIISFRAINRIWVPAIYLGLFCFFTALFGTTDILFALFTGGTLAAAFFLAGDPVTTAKSNLGALFVAVFAGILTFLFRYPGEEPYAAIFAIVSINALLPLIRFFESKKLYQASTNEEHA